MMASLQPGLEAYELSLPKFEGPFDVLIRLIEREQLEISEISLISVLHQFLTYIGDLRACPPSVIAEFAAVAGRLSLLKSRALLPKPPKVVEECEEPDLVRQLEEYRAVKAVAHLLADRQLSGAGAFGRAEGVQWPEAGPASLSPEPPRALAVAVQRWLSRIPRRPELTPLRRVVSLREMIGRLSAAIAPGQIVPFRSMWEECESRQDVSVAFLALLVLLRRQEVHASQTDVFGPIFMKRAGHESPTPIGPLPRIGQEG